MEIPRIAAQLPTPWLGVSRAFQFTRSTGKAGGAGGRLALLPGRGVSPIGANLSDRLSGTGGKAGDEGEASSPLHDGTVPIDVPSCRGELASPVCSTRTEALKFAPMGVSPQPLFSSAAEGGKRSKTGKLKSPVELGSASTSTVTCYGCWCLPLSSYVPRVLRPKKALTGKANIE